MTAMCELAAIAAAAWDEAVRRDKVLRPLAERECGVSRAEVAAAAGRLGISERWTFALIGRLRADRRASALVPRERGRPRGSRLLLDGVEAVVAAQIGGYFAAAQKPSKQALFEAIRHECRRRGLKPPGNETVRRRLKALDPVDIAARKRAHVDRGCSWTALRPSSRPRSAGTSLPRRSRRSRPFSRRSGTSAVGAG